MPDAVNSTLDEKIFSQAVATLHSHTVLFVDIVESTHLIDTDEAAFIEVWRDFISQVEQRILPAYDGRMIRSLGDGFVAIFENAANGVDAAFDLRKTIKSSDYQDRLKLPLVLRTGLDTGDFVEDHHDVYGRSAMVASRLTSMAGPDEILISANVCDQLSPGVDADVEDLGDCYLKHVREPMRVFRIGQKSDFSVIGLTRAADDLRPTITVIPFTGVDTTVEHAFLGEIVAEEVISQLSISIDANIISRLSASRLSGRELSSENYGSILDADYVVCGRFHINDSTVALRIELTEASTGKVLWSDVKSVTVASLFSEERELVSFIVKNICTALLMRSTEQVFTSALPTLKSYTLLIGAINLMYRLSPTEFNKSQALLLELTKRATRISEPYAWLANWHVLRVQQGWSRQPAKDGALALDYCKRALDNNPLSSISMAISGFVHTNLLRSLDESEQFYVRSLESNPNNSLAWLLQGTLNAFKGKGAEAVLDTEKAQSLSPIDPQKYFYDSLTATAHLANKDYQKALDYANRSYRLNRTHTSTLRVKAASLWHLGKYDEARDTAKELLALEPDLTVSGWLRRSPSADYPVGQEWAEVLRKVGVPE